MNMRMNWRVCRLFCGAIATLALALVNGGCGAQTGAILQAAGVDSRTANLVDAGVKGAQALELQPNSNAEVQMGESVAVVLTNKYGVVDDDRLTRYVRLVGMTLANVSPDPGVEYVFGVLNTNEVNAFAGPGGYILVTRGAIARMQDESELAGVLAHEMSHILNHDGLNAVKNANLLSAGVQAGTAGTGQTQFSEVANFTVDTVINKGYDRGQESKADTSGVGLVIAAGYNPAGYANFLRRMDSAGGNLMSTHPGKAERVRAVESQISRSGARGGQTLRDRFVQYTSAGGRGAASAAQRERPSEPRGAASPRSDSTPRSSPKPGPSDEPANDAGFTDPLDTK